MKRWRNRYRILDVSEAKVPFDQRRLACAICGHNETFTNGNAGLVLTDHCVSYDSKEEALNFQRSKYQLPFVETLEPVAGNYDLDKPAQGREGWRKS